MYSIQNSKFAKTIEFNCANINKINNWRLKFNDLQITTEQLLEDANKILYEIIGLNIRFENLIIFNDTDSIIKSIIILFFGGLFLFYGSEWFIDGAIQLANSFGISERIIGITVVSVGTSIPELVTSLVAVFNNM